MHIYMQYGVRKKEAINLKENGEEYMGGLIGRKRRENVII